MADQYEGLLEVYADLRDLAGHPQLPLSLRPRVLLMALQLARAGGLEHQALQATEAAVSAAEQWGNWAEVGLARLEAGLVLAQSGADDRAPAVLQLFLDHLDRYPWLATERGIVQYQLGLSHHRQRHYNAAFNAFRRAIDHQDGDPQRLLAAYHHACWLGLKLGRYRETARLLAGAAPLAEEDPEGAAILQALQALYFLRTSNTAQAEKLAAQAGQAAAKTGSERALALAAYARAEVAEARRHRRIARQLRQQVQQHLAASGCPELEVWLGATRADIGAPQSAARDGEQCFDDPASWSG